MLGNKRLFDDVARVAGGAAGAFGGLRSRMEGELRDQAERFLSRMNLVTREEYEVVAALAQKARAEQEILAERVAALEAKLSPAPSTLKPAKAKPKPASSAKAAPKPQRPKS
jgi:BMFP domain-containing protein YqiC